MPIFSKHAYGCLIGLAAEVPANELVNLPHLPMLAELPFWVGSSEFSIRRVFPNTPLGLIRSVIHEAS